MYSSTIKWSPILLVSQSPIVPLLLSTKLGVLEGEGEQSFLHPQVDEIMNVHLPVSVHTHL